MLTLKRSLIILCVGLLLMSIYHDLSKSSTPSNGSDSNADKQNHITYTVVELEVTAGDTLLSINDQLNHHMTKEFDVDQLLEDFMILNPAVNPHQLIIGRKYYFPKYNS